MAPDTPDIVGKTVEMAFLDDLVTDAAHRGDAVAVHGDPGVGKTTLLAAVARTARKRQRLVLETTGIASQSGLPFAGLHQLLSPVLGYASGLPRPKRSALMSAFGVEECDSPQPFLIALAAFTLISVVAEREPVLIVIDDAQWLDQPTHDALAFVARRVPTEPVAMVVAVRAGYQPDILNACQRRLEVTGLDDAASRELLNRSAMTLNSAQQHRILALAQGNPLALVELPAALPSKGAALAGSTHDHLPLSVRLEQAFAARLAEQPAPARDALLVAALESDSDLAEILSAASALSGSPVTTDALDAAVRAGLICINRAGVTFRHPLVQSAVVQREPLYRRQQAHAAWAVTLQDDAFRRTWHRAESIVGRDDTVSEELYTNHLVSLQRGSITAAIAALQRSAELTSDSATRGQRLLLAAQHAFGLGRADLVDQLVTAASETELPKLEQARMEWLREIFNDGVPGDAARVLELCSNARMAAAASDLDLALNLLMGAALRCWWARAGQHAQTAVVAAVDAMPDVCRAPRAVATIATADPIRQSRRVQGVLCTVLIETLSDADELRLLGQAAHAIGDPVRSVDFFDRAEVKLRKQGRVGLLGQVLSMGAYDHMSLGHLTRAVSALSGAQQIARDTGQPIWDAGSLSVNALALALRGDVDQALAMAAEAEDRANGRSLNNLLAVVQLARGHAFLSIGHPTEAFIALSRLFDPTDSSFHEAERLHGVADFVEAAVNAGHREQAHAVITELDDLAARFAAPLLTVQLPLGQALLAQKDQAEPRFAAALAADLTRWPWIRARTELAFGIWLRRQRRSTEARPLLRAARTTFSTVGAANWAALAGNELRAAGDHGPHNNGTALPGLLSAQEMQIAQLVAEGLSNKEIGDRLYLSPRTVGSHLYRIFPKLGITSRGQLAARLQRLA